MAEREDILSDGSDIDADYSSDEDVLDAVNAWEDRNVDPLDRAQMLNDDNFRAWLEEHDPAVDFPFGEQDEWGYRDFQANVHHPCNLTNENPGIHPEMQPHEIFNLFWGIRPVVEVGDERVRIDQRPIWTTLLEETNRYAAADQEARPPPPSRRWSPITLPELKTWIGLCLAMGVMKLPSRREYWRQQSQLFATNFNKYMSRDRFDLIWR